MKVEVVVEGFSLFIYLTAVVTAFAGLLDVLKVTHFFRNARTSLTSWLLIASGFLMSPVLTALAAQYSRTLEKIAVSIPLIFIFATAIAERFNSRNS